MAAAGGGKVEETVPGGPTKEGVETRFGVKCTTTTLDVDITMHAENRAKVVEYLKSHNDDIPAGAVILMEGGHEPVFHDTDHEPLFRQESNFHYLFGVKEPSFYGTIDVDSGRTTLYCPRLPASYATWMGHIWTCDEFKAMYKVDNVKYTDELAATLTEASPSVVLRMCGVNSDSGTAFKPASFDGINDFEAPEDGRLYTAVVESRLIKTKRELEIMRYQNEVSAEAHMAVMATLKPGHKEYQMESLFKHWCSFHGGARHVSYTCICATGGNGSTLHYGHAGAPNAKTIKSTDMCLFDMGGEYHRYGSDITCSFPASGTFTDDQRIIYNAVLDATWSVEAAMKAGVPWVSLHELSYRVILRHLLAANIVVGELDELMEANIGSIFMPHGLGHLLGIDTHDCGGYPEGATRDKRDGYRSLRCMRDLEAGMVITVEPGCYFNDYILDAALADESKARFLNKEAIARFRGFGGVRIEDNVLVTETHADVLTHVPRTVKDVEAVMAGRIKVRSELYKPDFTPGAPAPVLE